MFKMVLIRTRRFMPCFLTLLVLFNAGCSMTVNKSATIPKNLLVGLHQKKIALLHSAERSSMTSGDFHLYVSGRGEGAIKGALKGAVHGFEEGAVAGGRVGLATGPFVIIVAPITVIAGAVGGVSFGVLTGPIVGAISSPSADYIESMEKNLLEKVNRILPNIDYYGRLYEELHGRFLLDIDKVSPPASELVEVHTLREKFQAEGYGYLFLPKLHTEFQGDEGKDPPLRLKLVGIIDIVDIDQPENSAHREFTVYGPKMSASDWMGNNDRKIAEIFNSAVFDLVERIMFATFDYTGSN